MVVTQGGTPAISPPSQTQSSLSQSSLPLVDQTDFFNWPPLFEATSHLNDKMVLLLANGKADINRRTEEWDLLRVVTECCFTKSSASNSLEKKRQFLSLCFANGLVTGTGAARARNERTDITLAKRDLAFFAKDRAYDTKMNRQQGSGASPSSMFSSISSSLRAPAKSRSSYLLGSFFGGGGDAAGKSEKMEKMSLSSSMSTTSTAQSTGVSSTSASPHYYFHHMPLYLGERCLRAQKKAQKEREKRKEVSEKEKGRKSLKEEEGRVKEKERIRELLTGNKSGYDGDVSGISNMSLCICRICGDATLGKRNLEIVGDFPFSDAPKSTSSTTLSYNSRQKCDVCLDCIHFLKGGTWKLQNNTVV